MGVKVPPLPGFNPRAIQPVASCYTGCAQWPTRLINIAGKILQNWESWLMFLIRHAHLALMLQLQVISLLRTYSTAESYIILREIIPVVHFNK